MSDQAFSLTLLHVARGPCALHGNGSTRTQARMLAACLGVASILHPLGARADDEPVPAARRAARSLGVPDLVLNKVNNVGGSAVVGQTWNWRLSTNNSGTPATFAEGQTILFDTLPDSGVVYGPVSIELVSNITGSSHIRCRITAADLTCTATGGSVTFDTSLGPSHFDVAFTATPQVVGTFQNPRSGGIARIDPADVVAESDESNNSPAANTVIVGKAGTTTAIVSDAPDPSLAGQPVTVQWTVAPSGLGAVGAPLTGDVTVGDGTNSCVAIVSAGQCDVALTTPGTRAITATYAGDANYHGSASPPAGHTVISGDVIFANGFD